MRYTSLSAEPKKVIDEMIEVFGLRALVHLDKRKMGAGIAVRVNTLGQDGDAYVHKAYEIVPKTNPIAALNPPSYLLGSFVANLCRSFIKKYGYSEITDNEEWWELARDIIDVAAGKLSLSDKEKEHLTKDKNWQTQRLEFLDLLAEIPQVGAMSIAEAIRGKDLPNGPSLLTPNQLFLLDVELLSLAINLVDRTLFKAKGPEFRSSVIDDLVNESIIKYIDKYDVREPSFVDSFMAKVNKLESYQQLMDSQGGGLVHDFAGVIARIVCGDDAYPAQLVLVGNVAGYVELVQVRSLQIL